MSDRQQINVQRTERGWPGHFICVSRCAFRRNTLLEGNNQKIVVSTVGRMTLADSGMVEEIGFNRFFETVAFHAIREGRYWDADIKRQIAFDSQCAIEKPDADDKANAMHEAVISELTQRLKNGERL